MILEPLYTAAEMRAAEEGYPNYPESVPELMERAGRALAEETMRAYPGARRVAAVCGGGSNGGDGRVAVQILREAGLEAEETEELDGADVVVDALFGTGFRGAPRSEAAALIERINGAGVPVVACDLPSGVNASTGEVAGAAVQASLTVTFHGLKVGIVVAPGRFRAGWVVRADIGLEHTPTAATRATPEVISLVPRRGAADSKYSAGTVLVVGGSSGMTGAAALTATAALRADAGYVTLAVPEPSLAVTEALVVEAVKIGFSWETAVDEIVAAAERAGAVALGPGLGRSDQARALVRALLQRLEQPVVVDADALFGLEPVERSAATILTPHAGELGRLLGMSSTEVDAARLDTARRGAEQFGAVCLLKGADTIVASPDAGAIVCDQGPPSLATAGTGDVLTGVVAAFLAKGVEPRIAAAAAATAHGLAAASIEHQAGVVAGDVAAALPSVLS